MPVCNASRKVPYETSMTDLSLRKYLAGKSCSLFLQKPPLQIFDGAANASLLRNFKPFRANVPLMEKSTSF